MKMNYKWLRNLGNVFIAGSILGLSYTFWPVLREEWLYRWGGNLTYEVEKEGIWLVIPSLKISSKVISNVDPFERKEYETALDQGVALAKNTRLPKEGGLTYLFAHSAEAPWRMTRQNTAFYRLPKIKVGTMILFYDDGKAFSYRVTQIKTVWPTEVNYLKYRGKTELILQTCVPLGTDYKRLLVWAEPS